MIPQPHRDNFNTLSQAFSDGAACLLECHERATGRPLYVICAVNREGRVYELAAISHNRSRFAFGGAGKTA